MQLHGSRDVDNRQTIRLERVALSSSSSLNRIHFFVHYALRAPLRPPALLIWKTELEPLRRPSNVFTLRFMARPHDLQWGSASGYVGRWCSSKNSELRTGACTHAHASLLVCRLRNGKSVGRQTQNVKRRRQESSFKIDAPIRLTGHLNCELNCELVPSCERSWRISGTWGEQFTLGSTRKSQRDSEQYQSSMGPTCLRAALAVALNFVVCEFRGAWRGEL